MDVRCPIVAIKLCMNVGKICETCLSYEYTVGHCTLFSCFMKTVSLFIFEDVPKAENHLSLTYSRTVYDNMKRYSNPHTKLFYVEKKTQSCQHYVPQRSYY